MKRFITTLAIAAVVTLSVATSEANAQVTASSYSSGGTAISTAHGRGNTRLNSSAVATNGGYARSTMTGSGYNGGFASGNSQAISHGGVAISNGHSSANGWGARSHANSRAYTIGGFSDSNATAAARGNWSNAAANSAANTYYNYGRSSATAIDNRANTYQPYQSGNSYGSPSYGGATGMIQNTVRTFGFRRNR